MVRRGFTLIELLILLALTALLMSMLAPALSMGRKQAVALECQSNLRQVAFMRQASGFDRWGNSAYDFDEHNESYDNGEEGRGGGKGPQDVDNEDDPMRAKDGQDGSLSSEFDVPYDTRLENQSRSQPDTWTLVCPIAAQNDENSFGISFSARLRPFDRVAGSEDVILGCSVVKVVISIESFDYRHLDRANILFGDFHAKPMAFGEFSNQMVLPFERR